MACFVTQRWGRNAVRVGIRTAVASVSLCAAAFGVARADSVTLTAVKDNTIVQWSPETPEPNPLLTNGQGDLFAGRTNQDGNEEPTISIRRGLLKFNLEGAVPVGATITGVTLTLREVMGNNGDRTVSLHRVLADWGEGESFYPGGRGAPAEEGDATWFHTHYNGTLPCENACWKEGGDFEEVASASTIVTEELGAGQPFSWSNAGMKADVEAWLSNPATNFGWMLRGDETTGRTVKRFYSSESTEESAVPRLLIEFQAGLFGDFNDDHVVDVLDYVVWRQHLGDEIALPNEVETPGEVTNEDYGTWAANFGRSIDGAGANQTALVPEPAGAALAAVGMIAMAFARWRNRESNKYPVAEVVRLPH